MFFKKKESTSPSVEMLSYTLGGKKVVFKCKSDLKPTADFFAKILEEEDKSAGILKAGSTFQIGWGFYAATEKDGAVQIVTRDIASNPFENTTEDLSEMLDIFRAQSEVIQKTKSAVQETSLSDTMIVAKNALESKKVYFERQETDKEGDSGWYMGARDADPTGYAKAYTYQLRGILPDALSILQLPVGTIASFDDGKLIEIVDKDDKKIL